MLKKIIKNQLSVIKHYVEIDTFLESQTRAEFWDRAPSLRTKADKNRNK